MALFNECMPQCAQKVFDTADIVREGIFQQWGVVRKLVRTFKILRDSCPLAHQRKWRLNKMTVNHTNV